MEYYSRLAYALTHVLALLCFVRFGWWGKLPFLTAYVVVDGILAFTYNPESRDWIRYAYLRIEPVALALRFACGVEAIFRMPVSSAVARGITLSSALIGVAFAAFLWSVEPGSPVYTFVQIRRYAQIGTAVFLLVALVIVVIGEKWRWDAYSLSACVLLALLVKQAFYSVLSMSKQWTNTTWHAADWPGLLVTSLCLLLWSWLSGTRSRIQAP